MDDNQQDYLNRRANEVQNALVAKHGQETVTAMCNAVSAQGIPHEFLKNIITGPDAVNDFEGLAKESLLRVMQGSPSNRDTKIAEQVYTNLRERARADWRAVHGRR
jgi:hypothetical protein